MATITGLAWRRHISIACFWTSGTSSKGSSTPRSPRATMMASNALTISRRFATACGFSILAITGSRTPSSSMISWTRRMSLASRTKDSAIMSAGSRSAQRRSDSSLSERAGTLTATPGRLIPLLFDTTPPMVTSQTTSVSVTSSAISETLPSSISNRSPGFTSPGSPG